MTEAITSNGTFQYIIALNGKGAFGMNIFMQQIKSLASSLIWKKEKLSLEYFLPQKLNGIKSINVNPICHGGGVESTPPRLKWFIMLKCA